MKEIKLTAGALKLLKKLAKYGNEGEFNFDGRNCRPLEKAGFVSIKRTKDGKRILEVNLLAKGRKFLAPEAKDAADIKAAEAAIAEPGPSIECPADCCGLCGGADPAAGPVATPESVGPTGVGC